MNSRPFFAYNTHIIYNNFSPSEAQVLAIEASYDRLLAYLPGQRPWYNHTQLSTPATDSVKVVFQKLKSGKIEGKLSWKQFKENASSEDASSVMQILTDKLIQDLKNDSLGTFHGEKSSNTHG